MPTPLYRIKLVTNQKYTERPLNTRTCLIVDIFILKNFHYISFVLYRVSCVRIFSLINYLVRSCWCFSTELGSPLKVLKNESAAPSITKYFLVSTHWLFYFQFWILIMKGVKSCSGLSGFSLRSHHICREKKKKSVWSQVNPVFINRFYDEQAYIYCSFHLLASPEFSVQILVSNCLKNTEYTLSKTTKN